MKILLYPLGGMLLGMTWGLYDYWKYAQIRASEVCWCGGCLESTLLDSVLFYGAGSFGIGFFVAYLVKFAYGRKEAPQSLNI